MTVSFIMVMWLLTMKINWSNINDNGNFDNVNTVINGGDMWLLSWSWIIYRHYKCVKTPPSWMTMIMNLTVDCKPSGTSAHRGSQCYGTLKKLTVCRVPRMLVFVGLNEKLFSAAQYYDARFPLKYTYMKPYLKNTSEEYYWPLRCNQTDQSPSQPKAETVSIVWKSGQTHGRWIPSREAPRSVSGPKKDPRETNIWTIDELQNSYNMQI